MLKPDVTIGMIITDRQVTSPETVAKARQHFRLALDGKLRLSDAIKHNGWILMHRIACEEFGGLEAAKRKIQDMLAQEPALKFFKFWFHGRQQGAIGISYDQSFSCMAAGEAEAKEELALKFEVYHLKLITRAFRVELVNGDIVETEMNATLEEAIAYYGARAVKVEQV